MKICVIVYLLIILFLFLLIHPYIHYFIPIQEGMDDCIVNTLADLKNEVSELKKKVDENTKNETKDETIKPTPQEEEDGQFLKDNINSV
jgi:hypothetical protein